MAEKRKVLVVDDEKDFCRNMKDILEGRFAMGYDTYGMRRLATGVVEPSASNIALALLDDWSLPGLNGNPEKWDFNKLDLQLIVWINNTTLLDFMKCWAIPKNSLPPSPNGLMEEAAETKAPGLSEEA